MTTVEHFRELHHGGEILLMPNAWDTGSARVLQHLGFRALATTSGGAAAARGLIDGELDLATTLQHCAEITTAVDLPVSADLENCFADAPAGVAQTIHQARHVGLAGASIEDWDGTSIYELSQAVDRVAAAVDAADGTLVITARAENHFRGIDDLADTIERLQAFQQAGADVVYAPGIRTHEQIRAVLAEVEVPVNVLTVPGAPPVAELAELGVRRVSVGGSFAYSAYAALADAATELLTYGTYGYTDNAARGRSVTHQSLDRFGHDHSRDTA